MNIREQFEKETGFPAKFRTQRYGGDSNGPEIYNDEYIEWLEEKVDTLQYEIMDARNE